MRIRKKKYTARRLEQHAGLIIDQQDFYDARWQRVFPVQAPLHLEIGCGKGSFITQMAQRFPHINFVAVERVADVLVCGVERAAQLSLTNLKFVNGDAAFLQPAIAPSALSAIYINFCDPWLKKRQHKRRLTHRSFLEVYQRLLIPGGILQFKTDNRELFDFSLRELSALPGFTLGEITYDLHALGDSDNIVTEYEHKFSAQGLPIHRLKAVKPAEQCKNYKTP